MSYFFTPASLCWGKNTRLYLAAGASDGDRREMSVPFEVQWQTVMDTLGVRCLFELCVIKWMKILQYKQISMHLYLRCKEQANKYEYDVEFSGVGMGPPGSEPLGYCSQAAIFVSKAPKSPSPWPPSASSSSSSCEGDFKYTLVSVWVNFSQLKFEKKLLFLKGKVRY